MVIRWERKVFDFLKNLSQTPGHGTSWGTNFAGGVGKWKPKKKGVSKKMLGLGVGAGFLGGAALGVAGTMASYSVYHKYQVDIIHFQCLQHPKLRPESKYFRCQFFYTLSLYVAMKNIHKAQLIALCYFKTRAVDQGPFEEISKIHPVWLLQTSLISKHQRNVDLICSRNSRGRCI